MRRIYNTSNHGSRQCNSSAVIEAWKAWRTTQRSSKYQIPRKFTYYESRIAICFLRHVRAEEEMRNSIQFDEPRSLDSWQKYQKTKPWADKSGDFCLSWRCGTSPGKFMLIKFSSQDSTLRTFLNPVSINFAGNVSCLTSRRRPKSSRSSTVLQQTRMTCDCWH